MLHHHVENEAYEFRFLSYVLVEISSTLKSHLLRILLYFYLYSCFPNQYSSIPTFSKKKLFWQSVDLASPDLLI